MLDGFHLNGRQIKFVLFAVTIKFLLNDGSFLRQQSFNGLETGFQKVFGPIGVLVNNAGIYEAAPLDSITPEHFHRQFDLNVLGLLLVSQEAARNFSADGGTIVNISSGVSSIAPAGMAVYSATKAAVDVITSVLSKELASRKIRVNAVNPGMVITEGVKVAGFETGDMRNWIASVTPLGRVGTVEEIASVVAFLASNESSYVTGETLRVTGGLR